MLNHPIALYVIVSSSIILDLISGFLQAVHNHTVSSTKLRDGIFHKLAYFVAIALVLLLEYACKYLDLGFSVELFIPLCAYIVVTEAVSVFENLARINPELLNSPIFNLLSANQKRRDDDEK